jgi:hypothetical protein
MFLSVQTISKNLAVDKLKPLKLTREEQVVKKITGMNSGMRTTVSDCCPPGLKRR